MDQNDQAAPAPEPTSANKPRYTPEGWYPEDTNRIYLEVERGVKPEDSRYQGEFADSVRENAAAYLARMKAEGKVPWPVNE